VLLLPLLSSIRTSTSILLAIQQMVHTNMRVGIITAFSSLLSCSSGFVLSSMSGGGGGGGRLFSAACERNAPYILRVLQKYTVGDSPSSSANLRVLEFASGTGMHAAYFSQRLQNVACWQLSDVEPENFPSQRAWCEGIPTVSQPIILDASRAFEAWNVPESSFDACYAANVTHISPYEVTQGLITGAARAIKAGGKLFLYGPFLVNGQPTTESNAAFHASLQERDPRWGYRSWEDVDAKARAAGFHLLEKVDMPANNFMLIWEKTSDS
jgi:SAM-dependent methyltransferase